MFWGVKNNKIFLNIRLQPNAAAQRVGGVFVDADGISFLKIAVVAVPEKGKANKELITLLSCLSKLPKFAFTIISGETDRYKKIEVAVELSDGLEALLNRLGA